MGGKSKPKMPVTHFYMSVHMALCHGEVDSINSIYFNDKKGWDQDPDFNRPPPPPAASTLTVRRWDNLTEYGGPDGTPSGINENEFVIFETTGGTLGWRNSPYVGGVLQWEELVKVDRWQYKRVQRSRVIYAIGSHLVYDSGGESTNYHSYPTVILDPKDGNPHWPKRYTGDDDSRPFPVTDQAGTAENLVILPAEHNPPPQPQPLQPITEQTTITINKPDLFGGKKKEGGVAGKVHVMMGNLTQLMPAELASKFNRTPQTMPAYRGICNMFFYNGQGKKGFYWGSNRYYLPDVSVNLTRIPKGLNPSIARIGNDANPAHIIYECMTNRDWGMGAPNTAFDLTSFNNAAQTLYDEKFGLSMMWSDQMEIEAFIGEVLDHIDATLFVHPRNGLFTLKLIRNDYNVDELPEYTPDNATLVNFQRKGWGETINELTVTYKNPANEEEVSFTIQDPANIAMQGAVVTDNRNYYGIRNGTLASKVANRDLRAASAPLCSCEIEINRTAWDMVPGDVVLITWPEYGLQRVPMRVGPVDYGKDGSPRVRASLVEDVFFLPEADSYYIPPDTEWQDTRENALPIDPAKVITLPLFFVLRQPGAVSEEETLQFAYPEVLAGILGSSLQDDAQDYLLHTPLPNTVGDLEYEEIGARDLIGFGLNVNALKKEAISYTEFAVVTPKGGPVVGGFVLIGDVDDEESELVALETYEQNVGWRIRRGVLDTTPKEWPAETPCWFIGPDETLTDEQVRFDGDEPTYKLLTRTSLNTLALEYAPEVTGTLNGRPHLPFRPANVRLNSILWGPNVVVGGTLSLSWSIRNRTQETSVVLKWTDESVAPEDGQTTKVTWIDHEDETIVVQGNLSGLSTTLDFSQIPGPSVKYRVEAERDGLTSLQAVEHTVDVAGWGMSYGNYYGGIT